MRWGRYLRGRGQALGELERRTKREWSALYRRQERQREQLGGARNGTDHMPIHDRPVRLLIRDMIKELAPEKGQAFSRKAAIAWFDKDYSKIKEGTISAHLIRFSINDPNRLHR